MLVPEPSRSLYPSKIPELRAHVVVDGRPRLVFDMRETGNKVTGYISGAYDSEFEVRLWDGREKKATRGVERTLYFGDQRVGRWWEQAGGIEHQGPPDDEDRFTTWSHVQVGDEHTRAFKFGPVPTTGDRDKASRDADFLDGVSAIKITYRKIKNVKSKVVYPPPAPKKKKGEQSSASMANDPLAKQSKDKRAVHEQQEKGQFGVSATFGELKTVKKDPKKSKNPRKTTTWTYDYLNEDEPDLVFVFYIRSDPWIRARLADEEPEEVERSVTPPVEVGDTLYIGMTEKEIEEEEERAAKRPRVEKAPQDKGKRVVRPLSRSPSPTSTHADSPLDSGDLGGEEALLDPMGDDDSGSDGDSYLLARRRSSTSSASATKKVHFPSASTSSSTAPGTASNDLVAMHQAQLAKAEAANARLRAEREHRPNKRKELGDGPSGLEAACVEPAAPLEKPSPDAGSSTGSVRVDGAGSHSRMSSSTTMSSVPVEVEPVGAKSSSGASSSSRSGPERAADAVSASSAPIAHVPTPVWATDSPSSFAIRPDSTPQSSAAPQPLVATKLSTADEQGLKSASTTALGGTSLYPTHQLTASSLSTSDTTSAAPLAPSAAPADHRPPPSTMPHEPLVSPVLVRTALEATSTATAGPPTAAERAASVGGGQAFSLAPVGAEAQRRVEIKLELNEQRLAAETAEEHLAAVAVEARPAGEEKGAEPQDKREPQDKVEVKPEATEGCPVS
ncbi:uncharacterized protein RHOBADRAFT_44142 [Rhodotorula graminis WP1]|uniref:Uncharacterized protein n=1 Tax=Rhodotorula graminis (strain WP1) TaxID=578459 RepID=A0A194S1Z9_RHOGW|nr:uncharacterized protein RHOBADRAFT_44142 [Rhodotorula graminis WP1]KPV74627.1 hypothetical protein RHOBADRAFT_44142 [Rhodotorula graminis WP1]